MGKTKDSETLGVHLRKEVIAEIETRGRAMDKKKGTYAAMVLEKWFADGCPPVNEADKALVTAAKSAQPKQVKSAKEIDPWHLDPAAAYVLLEDDVVQRIMDRLRLGTMFDAFKGHNKFETFAMFDNHPTHWIEFTLIRGYGNKRDDGLIFSAWPKSTTPRYEIERKYRDHVARIGGEHKGPVKLSQIPGAEERTIRSMVTHVG